MRGNAACGGRASFDPSGSELALSGAATGGLFGLRCGCGAALPPWHRVCTCRGVRYSVLFMAAAFLAAGCARDPARVDRGAAEQEDAALADARPAAAALVFEPPAALDVPPEMLARDGRQPEAFFGYAEGVSEHFYLRWDDRQSNWGRGHNGHGGDRYERRAISEKVGVLYR